MKTPILQIPSDVGDCCRKVAKVLESSRDYLHDSIEETARLMEGEPDWTVDFPPESIRRTRDNLAKAAEFLNWLADHGEHQQPIERQPDADGEAV